MRNTKIRVLAIAASMVLVAILGLAACDSSSSSTETSEAASQTTAETAEATAETAEATSASSESEEASGPITTVAESLFSNWLKGMDKDEVLYLYADDEADESAMLMIYDTANDTFVSYTGKLEKASSDTLRINVKGAGDPIEFKVKTSKDGAVTTYTFANGSTVDMDPLLDDDVREFLGELDEFASELGSSIENDGATAEAE